MLAGAAAVVLPSAGDLARRASFPRVRRRIGFFLVVVGLVATVIGVASGCGSLFSFSGRHPIAVHELKPGTPVRQAITAKSGKRYTLAVQVVFEREGLATSNGALVVEAQLPLVASLEETKAVGWLDPNEPPTVLYGQSTNPQARGPAAGRDGPGARSGRSAGPPELVAERLVGPYLAPFDRDITYVVDLGPDRLGRAQVKEARIVVYDDTLPPAVTVAFVAAAAGVTALMSGASMLAYGLLHARRGGARRRPNV